MKAVIQRVKFASVTVDEQVVGKIQNGYLIFLGSGLNDSECDCDKLADKISKLRIFSDENDKINLSINDINGDILVVSQFTLYAQCKKGNRPSFVKANEPKRAEQLYEYFVKAISEKIDGSVQCGVFGADMKVELLNDGPFTVLLECENGEIIE